MENTEEQEIRSKREILAERLKAKYPELNDEDEEALFGAISDDYDRYDNESKSYQENSQKLTDLFNSDNRSASFLMKWRDGANPCVALLEEFGDEFREALQDPEMLDKFAEATKKYNEKTLKSKELNRMAEENFDASLSALNEAQQELGVSDEVVTKAFEFYSTVINDAIINKVSKETWLMFIKATQYDEDIADAEHIGEVRGKNTKINELKAKQTPKTPPAIIGGNGKMDAPQENIGILAGRGMRPSMWAGATRIKKN